MPLHLADGVATLTGVVGVDDAEPLSGWLRITAGPVVSLAGCTHLHTAALQAILAARPTIAGAPAEPFLARWIAPLLSAGAPVEPPVEPPVEQPEQGRTR